VGNKNAFKPKDVEPITNLLKKMGFNIFLFDSSVAYTSPRKNPKTHKFWAITKGWNKLGNIRLGDEYVTIKGKYMDYQVCEKLGDLDGVLVISHVKGHDCSGFGGAIKNLGMGGLAIKSKHAIHFGGKPVFKGKCNQCKTCELSCPLGSIKVKDKPIFSGVCFGCSNCAYVCPNKCIKPKVNYFDALLADGANSAQKTFKKFYYVSLLNNISKHCDCTINPGEIIGKDSGIIASKDGVAIDKAAHDIITENNGEDVFLKYNKKSGLQQVMEAEKLGMGSSEYQLRKI
jgi:uncharacterized Fe-S center protein